MQTQTLPGRPLEIQIKLKSCGQVAANRSNTIYRDIYWDEKKERNSRGDADIWRLMW